MKIAYWVLTALAACVAIGAFIAFDVPASDSVAGEDLAQWYSNMAILAAVVGAIVGGAMGAFAHRLVRPKVREAASTLYARVAGLGVASGFAAAALVTSIALVRARSQVSWPLSESERMSLTLDSGRFWAIPALAFLSATLGFFLLTRARIWHGQRALG